MNTNIIINWDKGLIPCIIQDQKTKAVLMVGYMNQEAYNKTITDRVVTFFSRSKNRLWTKGETSGNFLQVVDVSVDCDNDSILIQVNPQGPVCHTGQQSCFGDVPANESISWLEQIIESRLTNPSDESYTSTLFRQGLKRIAQKVGEEAIELVLETNESDTKGFTNEAADLLFHYLVLLQAKGLRFADVQAVLTARHNSRKESP